MIQRILLAVCVAVSCCLCAGAVEVTPVADVNFLMGQYFMENDTGAMGGNLKVFYTPVLNFNADTALLPIFSLDYRGTKDVQELVGGGTLTQEYLDISPFTLKLVRKFNSGVKGKVRIGYKEGYLKETVDETWTQGLFDYRKFVTGFEVEKTWADVNLRGGIDVYTMRYPNYSSLVSMSSTSLDATTYSEISQNAGVDVLDYDTNEVFIDVIKKFSNTVSGRVNWTVGLKNFLDQSIVNSTGAFTADLRNDSMNLITIDADIKLSPKTMLRVWESILYYTSDQNSYDAYRTKYIPNFYGFFNNNLGGIISFTLGEEKPVRSLDISLDLGYRLYQSRLTQAADGTYQQDTVYQNTTTIGVGYTHPVSEKLSVKGNINYRTSSSNMAYEQTYKYNYYVANYFVGLHWTY